MKMKSIVLAGAVVFPMNVCLLDQSFTRIIMFAGRMFIVLTNARMLSPQLLVGGIASWLTKWVGGINQSSGCT